MVWLYVFYELFIMGEMDYGLFSTNFTQWIVNTIFSLALTIILYGAGPFLYYKMFQYSIPKKELRKLSILYTVLAWLLGNLFIVFVLGGEVPRSGAALVWGTIFYRTLTNGLKKTGRLESPGSESGYWIPEPLEPTQKAPAEEAEKVEPSSFYESERAAEQQSQKFGPLDPPQKFKKRPASSKKRPHILYIICALSILFGVSSGIFFLYKANDVELRYEKGWHDGFNAGTSDLEEKYDELKYDYDLLTAEYRDLLVEHATLESEYDVMDEEYLYAIERSGFLMNSIGFIVNGSGYYHTYDCTEFQNADEFWAHNIEYCESLGYSKCPYCW